MKDVVKTGELEMWESPEPYRRLVGIMFERDITPTNNMGATFIILPVGQEQPKERKNVHDEAEEIYFVVRGKGKAVLGDRMIDVEKGTAVYVPPRAEHRFINTGDEEMELYWVISPAADAWPRPGGWVDEVTEAGFKKVREGKKV